MPGALVTEPADCMPWSGEGSGTAGAGVETPGCVCGAGTASACPEADDPGCVSGTGDDAAAVCCPVL